MCTYVASKLKQAMEDNCVCTYVASKLKQAMEDDFCDIVFDDYVEEEQESNPDDGTACEEIVESADEHDDELLNAGTSAATVPTGQSSKRSVRKCSLQKQEKLDILECVEMEEVLDSICSKVIKQLHSHVYKYRLSLFKAVIATVKAFLKSLCNCLTEIFVAMYKECEKGKDKYARFQVM